MKRLQRYEEFKNNQVQEEIDWKNLAAAGLATIGSIAGSPKQASGQIKKPTEIVQSVDGPKKDLLGRRLTAPPIVDKTTGRSTENLGKGKSLLTLKEVNPSEKRLKELKAKGWEVIMTEGGENKPKWGIKTGQKKPGVEFKNDNDKFFELGGYSTPVARAMTSCWSKRSRASKSSIASAGITSPKSRSTRLASRTRAS